MFRLNLRAPISSSLDFRGQSSMTAASSQGYVFPCELSLKEVFTCVAEHLYDHWLKGLADGLSDIACTLQTRCQPPP